MHSEFGHVYVDYKRYLNASQLVQNLELWTIVPVTNQNTYLVRSVNGRDNFCVALFQVCTAVRLIEYTHFAPYPAQLTGPPTVGPQSLSAQQIHRQLPSDD